MKKNILLIATFILVGASTFAQNNVTSTEKNLYNPSDNAKVEIANAVNKAAKEGKHVFLQIGGNWCKWCIAFDKKVTTNDTLRTIKDDNFVVYHLNYSKENKNEEVLKTLGFPQRFGFPVFVILDAQGKRLHTQNSAYLEEGKGYSTSKILEFYKQWSPTALDPKQYGF